MATPCHILPQYGNVIETVKEMCVNYELPHTCHLLTRIQQHVIAVSTMHAHLGTLEVHVHVPVVVSGKGNLSTSQVCVDNKSDGTPTYVHPPMGQH